MHRAKLSKPIECALNQRILLKSQTHLDYGCGKGDDVRRLRAMGINSIGYDPYWFPDTLVQPTDVVTLSYVLNVIEDISERSQTLIKAFELAISTLIVAVPYWQNQRNQRQFKDGFVSRWNVFIKRYTEPEFRDFIESTLQRPSQLIYPGIRAVYKSSSVYNTPASVLEDELQLLTSLWVPSESVFIEKYRTSYFYYYRLRSHNEELPGKKGLCKVLHLGNPGSDRYIWAIEALQRRARIKELQHILRIEKFR